MWDLNLIVNHLSHNPTQTKHYAIFFPYKNTDPKARIVTGINIPKSSYGLVSQHAEHNALIKLYKKKHIPRCLDLLVIRLSKSGIVGESRPCLHCIRRLQKMVDRNGVRISNVYYSTKYGDIERENLSDMENKDSTYVSSGYKQKRFRKKLEKK